MLEEEIIGACEKWIDEVGSDLDRMVRQCGDGHPLDPQLYRRRAALEGMILSLQAYSRACLDYEEASAVNGGAR